MRIGQDWQEKARDLQKHYRRFAVNERILLTGHSHQAWPDVAFDGQMQAMEDAARYIDDKWDKAFAKADRVRAGYAHILGDTNGEYVLGMNTQELLVRWLSALPLHKKPRLITTDGEFHSMRRLLDRLNETGVEVVKVTTDNVETLVDRIDQQLDCRTAAVMVSGVLFQTGQVVPGLQRLADVTNDQGIPLLVDAYHALNVLPWYVAELGLEQAFIVGGGYKYCQLGEGNCFLRVPAGCDWRPVVTGWFAEFATLDQKPGGKVQYSTGRWAFEGSTYDPASHYRAAAVLDFFAQQRLTPEVLYPHYKAQQQHLLQLIQGKDWPDHVTLPDDKLDAIGGFLVLRTSKASEVVQGLREQGVFADSRGDSLRLGPAPYVTAEQLDLAVQTLHRVMRNI